MPLRLVTIILVLLLLGLQYRLLVGDGSLLELWELKRATAEQQRVNERLASRNAELSAEVLDLKGGLAAVEERARTELGMIKQEETFFRLLPEQPVGHQ
ncbi:MAG: cell division protein FtsB [Gammaproteobacteria bacterium]|nr:cell division protein FtsB [Gammaproteobacteria bacterium]